MASEMASPATENMAIRLVTFTPRKPSTVAIAINQSKIRATDLIKVCRLRSTPIRLIARSTRDIIILITTAQAMIIKIVYSSLRHVIGTFAADASESINSGAAVEITSVIIIPLRAVK